jgi:hypothetical protein
MGWTTDESGLNSRQRQGVLCSTSAFISAVRLIHYPVQWALGDFPPRVKLFWFEIFHWHQLSACTQAQLHYTIRLHGMMLNYAQAELGETIFFFKPCPLSQFIKAVVPRGPTRLGVSSHFIWTWKQSQFPKRHSLLTVKIDKVQNKKIVSLSRVPSSEPYRSRTSLYRSRGTSSRLKMGVQTTPKTECTIKQRYTSHKHSTSINGCCAGRSAGSVICWV